MRSWMVVWALAGMSLLLAGCAGMKAENPSLKIGKTKIITLESNATTGYLWEVSKIDAKIIRIKSERYVAPNTELDGAPGRQEFTVEGIAPGIGKLELVYHRPWEKDVAPAKTADFVFQVEK